MAGDDVCGTPVPAGSMVTVLPYLINRNPAVWPNPAGFDPGRFLPDAPERHRYAWVPFGGGKRGCIGAGFARLEAVLVLARLCHHHRHFPASPIWRWASGAAWSHHGGQVRGAAMASRRGRAGAHQHRRVSASGGRAVMTRLIAAEFRKLFTTRLWLWLLLVSLAWTAGYCALAIVVDNRPGGLTPPLSGAAGQHALFAIGAGAAGPLAAILAAAGTAGEDIT